MGYERFGLNFTYSLCRTRLLDGKLQCVDIPFEQGTKAEVVDKASCRTSVERLHASL